MAIATKGKYNVALDDQGFILQGLPDRPAYVTAQAPVYGTRFASGDRDYNDLSQWWYLIQTDWSGGFKDTLSFEDDAKFYYSTNIDARTRGGSIRLERSLTSYYTSGAAEGADEILGYRKVVVGATEKDLLITNGADVIDTGGTDLFTSMGSPSDVFSFKSNFWLIGTTNVYGSGTLPISGTSVNTQIGGIVDGNVDHIGAHVIVGDTLYLFGLTSTDLVFCVKTSVAAPAAGSDWTLVFEIPHRGQLGPSVVGAGVVSGQIVFLLEGSPIWSAWTLDISSGVVTHLKDFPGDQLGIYSKGGRFVTPFSTGELLLTIVRGSNNSLDDRGEIWSYNGATITRLWKTDEQKFAFTPTTYEGNVVLQTGCVIYQDYAMWGNLAYDGTSMFNFIKTHDDDITYPAMPIGTDGQYLFMVDTEEISSQPQSIVYQYDQDGTAYKTSGFLVMSLHDKLQSIDKLMHNLTIGFEELAANEEIEVYYSELTYPTPDLTDWTLLGEATHTADGDDVTFKILRFPDGVSPKKLWLRIQLKGDGTSTPTVTDLTLEYLPIPDYRRQWVININAGDEIERLDGIVDPRTGREMSGFLEQLWLTKEVFTFQDIEYAATQLNGAIDDNDTTIVVDDTSDFPESGRLVVETEEIFYSGKTPNSFTGCVRGRQGTVAASHADNTAISTGLFKAIITNYQRQIPILQKDKKIEAVVQLSMRETGT